ncbi:hypothetical protein PHYSODRAFT_317192 [Phytophthora sojae]|uniref:DDE Tnp4 domain-containing protein n=1 Tax=Phytophthora sojae (strain P6497) TaxID=1094619 RepID=G4ZWX1_PHYSP|nr:hypothetical protein PHYSODRAFT_317192 [Phytophthora sojae]EGZ11742.1 hypothetical protein PHYSODRAFT_317192 [Phytophthora sojae]|eukprot:XP_009532075.1 hypothetical protein PHYSODRAFT_317192 [Phytophthora sojae]
MPMRKGQASTRKQAKRPLIPDVRFNLGTYADINSVLDFRFDVRGVRLLVRLFPLPAVVVTDSNDRCHAEEAAAVMPYRLIDYVDARYSERMYFHLDHVRRQIGAYCETIERRTSVPSVFALLDGTKIGIYRPSPRKGHRSENLQRLTTPDGLCMHFFGPFEGRRHDKTVLAASCLLQYFRENADAFEGKAIFGDPAYSVSEFVVTRFKDVVLSTHARIFNKEMSAVRTAVRLSLVGEFVRVAILLTNCHCCYNGGNQISQFFDLPPPPLEDYLDITN